MWTKETINAIRQQIVDEIRDKMKEKGAFFHTISHGIGGGKLHLRFVTDDTSDTAVDRMFEIYHAVVDEIVKADPSHPLVTLPVEALVTTPARVGPPE